MQSSSRVQPFKLVLAGASPATDATICIEPIGAMPMVARRKPLSRCNQTLHTALRMLRFVVQFHVGAPVSLMNSATSSPRRFLVGHNPDDAAMELERICMNDYDCSESVAENSHLRNQSQERQHPL